MLDEPIVALLDSISARAMAPQSECIDRLLVHAHPYELIWPRIKTRAHTMITALRSSSKGFSVEVFLQEYGLSSKEGVAVMCLAEALLRIPDRHTANKLIESTFDGAQWEKHLGHSDSLLVNASSWGLLFTGKMLQLDEAKSGVTQIFGKLVHGASEGAIRHALKAAMRMIASQFVLGETIEESLKKARAIEKTGYRFSYDMLGEGARSMPQAQSYFESYLHAIETVANQSDAGASLHQKAGVSIKLTALHPRYEWRQRQRVMDELLPRLKLLVRAAQAHGICVMIDAEEATRLDMELELFAALFTDPEFAAFEGIGFVLQAYQKRAFDVLELLVLLAQKTSKRMPIRLVKGAYWDSEIKKAQMEGLDDYPVFTVKAYSDLSYLVCARQILDHPACFYPQFATHNAVTMAAIIETAGDADYEFQRLYGMGEALYEPLLEKHKCCIYAPIGEHRDLLAYLIRRLLENGANSSFVHRLMDPDIAVDALLENPISIAQYGLARNPLVKPAQMYDGRTNSTGYEFGNRAQMQQLQAQLTAMTILEKPLQEASSYDIEVAVKSALSSALSWGDTPPESRAQILERAADLLDTHKLEAIKWCVSEGQKTIADAVAEWREAVDFCRYYAQQTRELFGQDRIMRGPTGEHNSLRLRGRGVFVCISPWNFPLAICMGQIAAALAAGNSVIAKPAEQTPQCAAFVVRILHEAGVPQHALGLVVGSGETVGAALVADERIAGVSFTGSTATAKYIQRSIAARDGAIIPLIAETGGQNTMLVDSSALLEQVVDDVVASAFGSVGQRCSALRVLFVQRDIADDFLALLDGAMQQIAVGDPVHFSTDIGPVIDAQAKEILLQHIVRMKREAKLIASTPLPANLPDGYFVAPHAFEIESIAQLPQEVFGPILHIIRYDANKLDAVIDSINATGYALTCGVHSRIPAVYERVASRIRAGNVYVNRSMIGATVGVQPFGGEGLSGTGPKAGGPHTLLRYATEQVVSTNSAAIGGNINLLMS